MNKVKVINIKNKKIIGDKIDVATSLTARLKGLLGRNSLENGEGLILDPCNAIHCIGMKFAIDVVFMDKGKKIIWIREDMEPGSREAKKDAVYVLELPAGVIAQKGLEIGDTLKW
ncbi:MAG: DUF192 domain-containing protein [Peptococcaceae bacterium]